MKHSKTILGLSALALACLGASVISAQPTVSAKADLVTNGSGLVMTNGAQVRVSNDWSGIRWETTVKAGAYDENAVFGVIVAPTKSLVNGDTTIELKHETVDCELDLVANGFVASETEDMNFYSVINYNNLAQEEGIDLAQAYKLELTARAYVKLGEEYHYADLTGINTSRSARQVAIAAELDGKLVGDQESAFKYYGNTKYVPAVKSVGAVGTTVIDLETVKTKNVNAKFASEEIKVDDIDEVLVGAERMRSTIAYKSNVFAFTVLQGQNLPTGEQYATVFMKDGTIKTYPVICATKVFDEISDFETFLYIRNNVNEKGKVTAEIQDGVDASKCVHDGYYVLTKDLTNSDGYYINNKTIDVGTNSKTATFAGWAGIKNFKDRELGLTGTFNGLGHKIENVCGVDSYSSLFQLINGGTVKNLSLNYLAYSQSKFSSGLAYYAIDPIIENVHIYINEKFRGSVGQTAMFSYIHQTEAGSAKLRNVYADITYNTNYVGERNGLFGMMHGESNTDISWENVYMVSHVGLAYWVDESALKHYAYGENEGTADAYTIYAPNGEVSTYTTATNAYYCKGARHYYTMDAFKADSANYDLSAFANDASGCWDVVDGVPVWKSLQAQN